MEMFDETVIPGAHRVIRRLGPDEGPYSGDLVVHGDGAAVRVAADAESVHWEFAGAEHVAGPLEVLRASAGNAVLLPWCTRNLGALVAQRRAAGEPPDAGECVTLAVSLLRGVGELEGSERTGSWWVTAEGRPVIVPGGAARARDSAAEVLASLGDASTERALKRLLGEIREALVERSPSSAQRGQWEDALCAYAAPRPLRLEVFAPADASIARTLRPTPVLRRRDHRVARPAHLAEAAFARVREAVGGALQRVARVELRRPVRSGDRRRARGADTGAESAASAAASAGRQPRPSGGRRMLVAGLAAGAVLLVGALWPDSPDPAKAGEGAAHGAGAVVRDADASGSAVPEAAAEPDHAMPGNGTTAVPQEGGADTARALPTDPVRAAGAAMHALLACWESADARCEGVVANDADVDLAVVAGAHAAPAELVDDYGDVAVVRLGAGAEERMLVLIRRNDVWLVRDVLDVADQPDGSD